MVALQQSCGLVAPPGLGRGRLLCLGAGGRRRGAGGIERINPGLQRLVFLARGAKGRERAIGLFVVQLLINYAWSPAFFAYHKVDLALGMIAAMIVLTLATALLFARIRRAAALLLLPYLAWLCFAGYLTYGIAALNPDAETLVPGAGSADIAL